MVSGQGIEYIFDYNLACALGYGLWGFDRIITYTNMHYFSNFDHRDDSNYW